MQGQLSGQQELFVEFDISNFVPENHLLRKLDRTIDIAFVRELTKPFYAEKEGRPSIDPELFFRMQILFYLYGIRSERQLCEQIHLNLAFRWFCKLGLKDKVPDHSSMTKIRNRFGEALFKATFETLIERFKMQGLIKGQSLIADSSLIEADASIEREEIVETTNGVVKINKTDPDATKVGRAKFSGHAYHKNHYIIDGASRMIVDTHATTGSKQDSVVLNERIDYQINRHGFKVEEAIADKGYGTGPVLSGLRERKIRAFIPIFDRSARKKQINRDGFSYEKESNRVRCPAGQYLYPHRKFYDGSQKYRMVGGHCKGCESENICLSPKQKHRALTLDASIYFADIEKARAEMSLDIFKQKLLERKWKIEGLFGEGKMLHNMRRAKYRGRSRVQIQFYMIAMVQNFKRALGAEFSDQICKLLRKFVARAFAICRF